MSDLLIHLEHLDDQHPGWRERLVANPNIEAAAKAGHDAYERLAPEYGYTTRQKSRVPWERLPQEHRDLMKAAYAEAVAAALTPGGDTQQ